MPRKSKLNPALAANLIKLIRAGNYISIACRACRITEATYYNWQSNARTYETYINNMQSIGSVNRIPSEIASLKVYFDLFEDIKTAEAESEAAAVALILKAAPRNWLAAATWLSRRFKERWRDDNGQVQDTVKLGLQVLDRLTAALERPGAPSVDAGQARAALPSGQHTAPD